jgi:hypothetical protein
MVAESTVEDPAWNKAPAVANFQKAAPPALL